MGTSEFSPITELKEFDFTSCVGFWKAWFPTIFKYMKYKNIAFYIVYWNLSILFINLINKILSPLICSAFYEFCVLFIGLLIIEFPLVKFHFLFFTTLILDY